MKRVDFKLIVCGLCLGALALTQLHAKGAVGRSSKLLAVIYGPSPTFSHGQSYLRYSTTPSGMAHYYYYPDQSGYYYIPPSRGGNPGTSTAQIQGYPDYFTTPPAQSQSASPYYSPPLQVYQGYQPMIRVNRR